MKAVILVLTAGFGDGHNSAAAAVGEALRLASPEEEVIVCDPISEAHPLISDVLKRAYQLAIIQFPWVWKALYRYLGQMDLDATSPSWMVGLLRDLRKRLLRWNPRAVVSTYPLYASLLKVLAEQGEKVPKLVTVITDSTTVHPIWLAAPSDLYCVADEETDAVLHSLGVPPVKTRITGFPVNLDFTCAPASPPVTGVQRILYLPSTPVEHVEQTLFALKPLLLEGAKLTLPVGKHASRLFHSIRRFIDSLPLKLQGDEEGAAVEIIGWTRRMPELLMTHDVIICKAGGAILHEVMAARIPAVIDYVVPGQEEGNAEYLLSRNCARRSHRPEETASAVRSLLEDKGKLARVLRENLLPISVPDAAERVAVEVLRLATRTTT